MGIKVSLNPWSGASKILLFALLDLTQPFITVIVEPYFLTDLCEPVFPRNLIFNTFFIRVHKARIGHKLFINIDYFGRSSRRTDASSYIGRYSYTDRKRLHIWVYIYKIWMSNPRLKITKMNDWVRSTKANKYVYFKILNFTWPAPSIKGQST